MKQKASAEEIKTTKLYLEMGLTAEEYALIEKYLGRLPNYTETGVFAVLWSEHCSYKNSKKVLSRLPTKGRRVLQGPGEGAGVVDIGDGQAVVFKIESHNHPSALEPYQGAATGVGGILRDVFSMGAEPIALLNSLRLGELQEERNQYLLRQMVAGIADYSGKTRIPTLGGEIQFDGLYDGNPLMNAMAVGVIKLGQLQKGLARGVGNPVIYAGAKTGRDGIHGATFASGELSAEKGEEPTALQVGYPEIGKRLMAACLEASQLRGLVGMQDMGAAGLTSSSAEMASKAGTGIELDLDLVPQREEGLTAYEMMLSESQERMLLVVEKGREQEFIDLFKKHGLEAAVIGKVTDNQRLRASQGGELWADLPIWALVDQAPVYERPFQVPAYYQKWQASEEEIPAIEDLEETFLALLQSPTIASKAWVYEQFNTAQRGVIRGPGANAGVVAVAGTEKGLALTVDGNSRYTFLDPYQGGAIAVAEAARNIVCSGGEPLAATDGLNFGNPLKPEIFWQLKQSVEGIKDACQALETPIVSGNVSLYNETGGEAIYPTPIVGMVGLVEDLSVIPAFTFQKAGDVIYLLGTTKPELGGSELQKMHYGRIFGRPPQIDLQLEVKLQRKARKAIQAGLVRSARDLSVGGLGVALAESLMDGELGANVSLTGDLVTGLFSESQSRFLFSVPPAQKEAFEALVTDAVLIGEVVAGQKLGIFKDEQLALSLDVAQLKEVWKGAIPCVMKSKA